MNTAGFVCLAVAIILFFVEAFKARSLTAAAWGFVFLAVFVSTVGPVRITDD